MLNNDNCKIRYIGVVRSNEYIFIIYKQQDDYYYCNYVNIIKDIEIIDNIMNNSFNIFIVNDTLNIDYKKLELVYRLLLRQELNCSPLIKNDIVLIDKIIHSFIAQKKANL